jgi:phage minor structural protein GP20
MAYDLKDLLKGLDDSVIEQVQSTVKQNTKELNAKLFIDGDGDHYVPHARFDEVVNQRDQANSSITSYKSKLEELSKQVEEGSAAQATVQDLTAKLEAQSKLAKSAILESRLQPLITDSIAPASDILGFMDVTKIHVNDDGSVTGLEEQLKEVKDAKKYLFQSAAEGDDSSNPGKSNSGRAGTGNIGNSGRLVGGGANSTQVGSFGKQLAAAQAAKQAADENQFNFFK